MKTEAKSLAILFCTSLLASCAYNPFSGNNHTTGSPSAAVIGAAAGAGGVALLNGPKALIAATGIGGGMLGYYVTTLQHDAGAITRAGGKVYQQGEFLGIYIPTDVLFEPNTADLLPQASPILDSVATVLARTPQNNILISGNTSGFYRSKWEQRLSEKRAQKISAYLWKAGINQFDDTKGGMRKLNYVGYGDYFPIANHYTNEGIRQNSRIQITSYPTKAQLGLCKRQVAFNNMGALNNDGDINNASKCGEQGC